MFGLYITHPQVQIDPDVPVPKWGLSSLGSERAQLAANLPWAGKLGRILSSDETKALETAAILASRTGIAVEQLHNSGENDRSATGFLPAQAFEAAADRFFARPDESFSGWERAIDAQVRIVAAVEALLATHDPAIPLAIVGHGAVGTLLKSHLLRQPISRSGDQPPGGGHLFAFALADRVPVCEWTPMEFWQGWTA